MPAILGLYIDKDGERFLDEVVKLKEEEFINIANK